MPRNRSVFWCCATKWSPPQCGLPDLADDIPGPLKKRLIACLAPFHERFLAVFSVG
jgi:hypothetical protein